MHLPLEKARNSSNGHQTTSLLIYSEVTELGGGNQMFSFWRKDFKKISESVSHS